MIDHQPSSAGAAEHILWEAQHVEVCRIASACRGLALRPSARGQEGEINLGCDPRDRVRKVKQSHRKVVG